MPRKPCTPINPIYYIYVLAIEGDGWYVGATRSLDSRILRHFFGGGSMATRQRKALYIADLYRFQDYAIGRFRAYQRAEIMVAHHYAQQYGVEEVRGGKHGAGWGDALTNGNLRDISRCIGFAATPEGEALLRALSRVSPSDTLSERTKSILTQAQIGEDSLRPRGLLMDWKIIPAL